VNKIKVLIIDDSSVIRNIVRAVLEPDENIEVVGEAEDPIVARDLIKKLNPDVLTLDVEMPKMDGITFLRNLMRLRPMPVVMLSTLTTKGADITLEALETGAIDFIAKPSVEKLIATKASFKEDLLEKVKFAASVDPKSFRLNNALTKVESHRVLSFTGLKRTNHLIAIGASTGGTDALKKILVSLPNNAPPIVIALHIPKAFSTSYAKRLNELCTVQVQEAQHGQKIKEGNVYLAPGDLHLKIAAKGGALFCTLEDSEEVNRHKPAVDVLFDSLIGIAPNIQAVLLTGMGNDGAQGMLKLKNAGARTLIQDEQSSLIWGMPGCAFNLNAHCSESPLLKVAKNILTFASLDRNAMRKVLDE